MSEHTMPEDVAARICIIETSDAIFDEKLPDRGLTKNERLQLQRQKARLFDTYIQIGALVEVRGSSNVQSVLSPTTPDSGPGYVSTPLRLVCNPLLRSIRSLFSRFSLGSLTSSIFRFVPNVVVEEGSLRSSAATKVEPPSRCLNKLHLKMWRLIPASLILPLPFFTKNLQIGL